MHPIYTSVINGAQNQIIAPLQMGQEWSTGISPRKIPSRCIIHRSVVRSKCYRIPSTSTSARTNNRPEPEARAPLSSSPPPPAIVPSNRPSSSSYVHLLQTTVLSSHSRFISYLRFFVSSENTTPLCDYTLPTVSVTHGLSVSLFFRLNLDGWTQAR